MHHNGLVAAAVFANVFQVETARQVEIELHGAELPGPADGVDELHVDLGAVEDGFAGNIFVRNAMRSRVPVSAPSAFSHSSAVPA